MIFYLLISTIAKTKKKSKNLSFYATMKLHKMYVNFIESLLENKVISQFIQKS
jgi:hypothetical protein